MTYTPEQQAALDKIDVNIDMFSKYPAKPHVVESLERFRSNRAELVEWFEGKRERKDVSWLALEWTFNLPDWATKGT